MVIFQKVWSPVKERNEFKAKEDLAVQAWNLDKEEEDAHFSKSLVASLGEAKEGLKLRLKKA